MSRRYGRNQRRRHREELADLQQRLTAADNRADQNLDAVHAEQSASRRLAMQKEALEGIVRHWDQEVRRLLGPYTAAAMTDLTMRVGQYGVRELPVLPRLSMDSLMNGDLAASQLQYHVERVISVIYRMPEADRLTLSRQMMVRFEDGGERVGAATFGMSRDYWQRLAVDIRNGHVPGRLIEKIAADLLKVLAGEIANERRRA